MNYSLLIFMITISMNIYAYDTQAAGLHALTVLKLLLGISAIIGGIGFFITTAPKYAHISHTVRRLFMGMFIGANILLQILLNVINLPANTQALCCLGHCWARIIPSRVIPQESKESHE